MLDSFLAGTSLVIMVPAMVFVKTCFLSVYQLSTLGGVSCHDGIRSRRICSVGSPRSLQYLFRGSSRRGASKDGLLPGIVKVAKRPPSRTEGHPMSLWHAVRAESSTSAGEEGREPNISSLLEMLGRLADPRSPQGRRHELVFTVAGAVVAVLAGASNYRQVASQVADLPQSLLAKLGASWNWFQHRYDWPSEPTL
jgi:hypothetical protein